MKNKSIQISETLYRSFFESLVKGDSSRSRDIVNSLLKSEVDVLNLYENLFRRALYQIGEYWAKSLISVAEEHIATAIVENLLSQVQSTRHLAEEPAKRALIACITYDLHQVGAKMVANIFEIKGWESIYLGANMPIIDLLNAIDRIKPNVVCLSLALMEHIKTLVVTVKEIQVNYKKLPIIIGGRALLNTNETELNLESVENLYLVQSIIQLDPLIDQIDQASVA